MNAMTPRPSVAGFDFARAVPADGYAWWYLDALSPDGRHGLTLIAFVGSVFSPYYAAARQAGPADPLDHCCLNVCLYLPGARRWTMIERDRSSIQRGPDRFTIGPSALDWDGARLRVRFDEVTALRATPVRGEVVARPGTLFDRGFELDPDGRHVWRPLSVDAQVDVRLDDPALSWSGTGYIDHNFGAAPLERDFRRWTWSRSAADAAGVALVDYDVELSGGGKRAMSLALGPGGVEVADAPPARPLTPSAWGLARQVRAGRRRVVRTLEDTPFYARSSVRAERDGQTRILMHEHLSLRRFAHPMMQWALPYRIKREG